MADKTIKNPLRKRILRDIRKEKGKYISIFLFLTFMIAIVSGMLVTSLSMMHTYDDGIETYKLEDGHFSTNSEISVSDLQKIADQADSGTEKATIYKQYFYNFDYTFDGNSDYSIRLYENREALNTYSVFEGFVCASCVSGFFAGFVCDGFEVPFGSSSGRIGASVPSAIPAKIWPS